MNNLLTDDSLRLRTPRLRFDTWSITDLPFLLALHSDPVVQTGYPYSPDYWTETVIAQKLNSYIKEQDTLGTTKWKLSLHDDTFIGRAGWSHWEDGLEIGYAIMPSHQGRGYALEAATALLAHAREQYPANRLVGFALPNNRASRTILEKIGMTYEGQQNISDIPTAFYRAT